MQQIYILNPWKFVEYFQSTFSYEHCWRTTSKTSMVELFYKNSNNYFRKISFAVETFLK